MGGLAIGALLFGRFADRLSRPLLLYAGLEAAVAIAGIGVTLALPRLAGPFANLEGHSAVAAWALVLSLVALPAVLMGGTLPAIQAALSSDSETDAKAGGLLYAANTSGAILGTLLTSFLLIPALGLAGTSAFAACWSFAAAILAFAMSPRRAVPAAVETDSLSRDGMVAVGLYAVAGGIALGYEVIWTQSIVQFMSTRAFAFTVVLATYLAGLAAGAAFASPFIGRVKNLWSLFGFLIAGAGALAILETALLGPWIVTVQSMAEYWTRSLLDSQLAGMSARFAVAALTIVFLPTLLLGAAFPVVLRIITREGQAGRSIGLVGACNTLGAIAGSIITGFVLVPGFGFVRALSILALLAAAVGLLAISYNRSWKGWATVGIAAASLVSLVCFVVVPTTRFADLLPGARKGALVFYEEGLGATVAVVEQGTTEKFRRLYIQGVSNTGDPIASLRYMRLQALLPLIVADTEPRSSLVIGLGTGITAGATLAYDGLEKRVAAELLPGVRKASALFSGNYGAANDPRLDVRLRDGRRELLASADSYDMITLEPPPPSASGVANLYSTDFYRLAASRLNPGGVVAQWLPLPTQNSEDTKALVRSFIDIFPHASLWTTELHEMLLVGSMQPMPLDYLRMLGRFEQPGVKTALADVGVVSLPSLLTTWVTDRAGLASFAGDALPVTDDRPSIEYGTWTRPGTFETVLPEIMRTAAEPPVQGMPDEARAEMGKQRDLLYALYKAGLAAYANDRETWQLNGTYVMSRAADNPYFSSIFAGTLQQ